jgi:hypothetical protein
MGYYLIDFFSFYTLKKCKTWEKETWPGILKMAKRKNAHLMFGDEASFPQWGSLSYTTWARKGKLPVVKTSGSKTHNHMSLQRAGILNVSEKQNPVLYLVQVQFRLLMRAALRISAAYNLSRAR